MIRLTSILFVVVFLYTSCKQRKDSNYIHTLSTSLENSNQALLRSNYLLYLDFEDKFKREVTAFYAERRKPGVNKLRQLSQDISTYLTSLENELRKKYKYNWGTNDQISRKFFIEEGRAHDIFLRVLDYKQQVMALLKDETGYRYSHLAEQIRHNQPKNEQNWLDSTFKSAGSSVCEAVLCAIKNDVLVVENSVLDCFNSSGILICGMYYQFYAIASLSSSYVKSGDSIEVVSGIGEFTAAAKPAIYIDGKRVALNSDGTAVYSFRVNKKPGKHFVPVRIDYTKPDGSSVTVFKNCYYTIAQ